MLSSTVQTEAAAPYHLQAMPDADFTGTAGVRGQGPYLQLFAKVERDVVKEASYETYTCPNAIACGSWVTRWMEGRGAGDAEQADSGWILWRCRAAAKDLVGQWAGGQMRNLSGSESPNPGGDRSRGR